MLPMIDWVPPWVSMAVRAPSAAEAPGVALNVLCSIRCVPSATVVDVTRSVVRLQTGYLYHYAFAMLIGVAAFITWFMFAGGPRP